MSEEIAATKKTTLSATVTITTTEQQAEEVPVERMAVLKLRKPKSDKRVVWSTDTIDNEEMNKKKSKCCCVYHKKLPFGQSDSEDSDDECDHCTGHVEKKVQRRMQRLQELAQTQVEDISGNHKDNTPMDVDGDNQNDIDEPGSLGSES